MDFGYIRDNLSRIRETIAAACAACGRREEEITLVGVTKTVPAPAINAAIGFGLTHIGENRVQEYLSKQPDLRLDEVTVHLIGHLQTNKVKKIVGQVDMIESIDSLKLAQAVDAASQKLGMVTKVLVQVNIGEESSKSGVAPDRLEELLDQIRDLSHIRVCGLMAIPPISDTEAEKRHFFSKMYQLFLDTQRKNKDNMDISVLSMGMSGDYREAILEGATEIRIGSALFGSRQ